MNDDTSDIVGIAEVLFSCGRAYMTVGDFIVAMEGDPCRDAEIDGTRWSRESLCSTAREINRRNRA